MGTDPVRNHIDPASILEALQRNRRLLNEIAAMARVGGWEHDLVARTATWTDQLYDIVELEPGTPPPGPDEHLAHYPEKDRAVLARAMAEKQVRSLAQFPLENPAPVLRVDFRGTVLFANPACAMVPALAKATPGSRLTGRIAREAGLAIASKTVRSLDLDDGERVYSLSVAPFPKRATPTSTATTSPSASRPSRPCRPPGIRLRAHGHPDAGNGRHGGRARIRAMPGQRGRTPVIALTAHSMAGDRERFLAAGMNGYLAKPVDMDILEQAVAEAILGTEEG